MIKIIECPRDAMQGISKFIPTETKTLYINELLKVGFDTIDFGSFVSFKAIPQLRDTVDVLSNLDLSSTSSKLLTIIANTRGATDACNFEEIDYLGFPLSVSEQFQQRNTKISINEALKTVEKVKNLSIKNNKEMVVYLSMAFGNPYGEKYHPNIIAKLVSKLNGLGIRIISLSDTIGVSAPDNIEPLFCNLINEYPAIEFGAHFHTTADKWKEKVNAAYQNGCRRFDSAIKGYGGCPMAKNVLVGNMPTENLIKYFKSKEIDLNLDNSAFESVVNNMSTYF